MTWNRSVGHASTHARTHARTRTHTRSRPYTCTHARTRANYPRGNWHNTYIYGYQKVVILLHGVISSPWDCSKRLSEPGSLESNCLDSHVTSIESVRQHCPTKSSNNYKHFTNRFAHLHPDLPEAKLKVLGNNVWRNCGKHNPESHPPPSLPPICQNQVSMLAL